MQFEASLFKATSKCTFCLFLWISEAHTGDKEKIWNMVKSQFFTVSFCLLLHTSPVHFSGPPQHLWPLLQGLVMKRKKERRALGTWERKGLVTQSENFVGNTQNEPPWGNGRLRPGRNWGGVFGTVRQRLMTAVKATAWISLDLIGLIKAMFLAASLPSCRVSLVLVRCSIIGIKPHFLKGMLVTPSQKHSGKLVEGWGFFFSNINLFV